MKISNSVNLPDFLLSSENNGNISLTIKSVLVLAIIYGLSVAGITANQNDIIAIVENVVTIIAMATTLYGLLRKVMARYEGK